MVPTPKEVDGRDGRIPIALLFVEIQEGCYPWLTDNLRKVATGLLLDGTSTEDCCLHLVCKWEREGRLHTEVRCGNDFRNKVDLRTAPVSLDERIVEVDWGERVGKRVYWSFPQDNGYGKFFTICFPTSGLEASNLSYGEAEIAFLRAAGRSHS